MTTADLLRTGSSRLPVEADLVAAALDALRACSLACSVCASACLSADEDLSAVVRDALDCADVADAAVRVLARSESPQRDAATALLAAVVAAAQQCAGSCSPHAEHREHCARCAASCEDAAGTCQALLDAVREV